MDERSRRLAHHLALLGEGRQKRRHAGQSAADRTWATLAADLAAARRSAGLTQEEVAARMSTAKSAVSRLERGAGTRPNLRTIQRYALAVGATVEIRVRAR